MTTSVVMSIRPSLNSRHWLVLCGGALIAFFALLWGATPAHAATIYHVDDSVNDGLIAYYKLENTFAGDTLAWDIVGKANGSMHGTSTFGTSELPPIIGQQFGALQMTGVVTDQVLITHTINFGNAFTVAAWVKRGQTNDFQTIFDAGTGTNNGHWYVAIGDNAKDNSLVFGRRGTPELFATTAIDTNWHHIAVSHSANDTVTMYLDGAAIATFTGVTLTVPSGAQRIGAVSIDNGTAFSGNFNGGMDELRLYNRDLSQSKIQRLADGFGCVFDGLTWAKAFRDLQCALEVSGINDIIRVAKGRYIPGINPDAHYAFGSGDIVQGSFNGDEPDNSTPENIVFSDIGPSTYVGTSHFTILTGDLRGDDPVNALTDPNTPVDEEEDNLHHVFTVASAAIGTALSGFVITGGRNTTVGAEGAGGVINGAPTIANSVFVFNRAANGGGLAVLTTATPHLNHLLFMNNAAIISGGAIESTGILSLNDSRFFSNTAGVSGGGVEVSAKSALLTHVDFEQNQSPLGGGINISGTLVNFFYDGGELFRNNAGDGGGLYLCCTSAISTLQHVTVTANSAISDGGGIFVVAGAILTITDGLLTSNQSQGAGSAVNGDTGAQLSLIDSRVQSNTAAGPGAIFFTSGPLRLTRVQFIHNHTESTGGAAVAVDRAFNDDFRQVDFIENATGDDDGAAIRIRRGTLVMDRVSFLGNAADSNGGALSIEDGAQVTATNALFAGNSGNNGDSHTDKANAIYIENNSALRLINSTLADNSGTGIGLVRLRDSGTLTLTNVILWNNAPPALANQGTGTVTQQHVISGSPASGVNPHFVRNPDPGDGNWATFSDNDYGDLHLSALSPAIDQGDGALLPTGISQDFDGNARIFDVASIPNAFAASVDLGALEARFVAPTANAGGPYRGDEGKPIALDGSTSSDDGSIVTYAWDCTNDNSDDATSSSPTGESCTYPDQGVFTLRLRVTDNDGISNSVTVSVTVDNLPPLAQNDSVTTTENTPITINVLANDSDVPADPLTITSTGAPSHGSAAIEAGKIRYTPAADFHGSDTFTCSISDGDGGTASATVKVTVTPAGNLRNPDSKPTLLMPFLAKGEEGR